MTHLKRITETLHCSESQAQDVERYINHGNMINWADASASLVNTITKAVHAKLLRDAPAKKKAKVKVTVTKTPKAKAKAPAKGTKIAHAMEVYKAMSVDGVRSSRQDIISAMANSMQIEKKAAAGYFQSCKKKMGE